MNPDKLSDIPSREGVAFPKNKNNSTNPRKKVMKIVGGTVLAIAVAFGGGTALSQIPNTFVQGVGVVGAPATSDQSTQAASQKTNSATTISTNAAVLPDVGNDTVANSVTTIPGPGGTGNGVSFTPDGRGHGRAGGGR